MPDEFSITSVRLSRQLTAVPRMNSTTTASLISGLPPFVRWAPPMQFSTGSHEDDRKRSDGFPDSVTDTRAYQTPSLCVSRTLSLRTAGSTGLSWRSLCFYAGLLCTLPVVVAFKFFQDASTAPRVSKIVVLTMLFLIGYSFDKQSGPPGALVSCSDLTFAHVRRAGSRRVIGSS
jgi:hypothetical protein